MAYQSTSTLPQLSAPVMPPREAGTTGTTAGTEQNRTSAPFVGDAGDQDDPMQVDDANLSKQGASGSPEAVSQQLRPSSEQGSSENEGAASQAARDKGKGVAEREGTPDTESDPDKDRQVSGAESEDSDEEKDELDEESEGQSRVERRLPNKPRKVRERWVYEQKLKLWEYRGALKSLGLDKQRQKQMKGFVDWCRSNYKCWDKPYSEVMSREKELVEDIHKNGVEQMPWIREYENLYPIDAMLWRMYEKTGEKKGGAGSPSKKSGTKSSTKSSRGNGGKKGAKAKARVDSDYESEDSEPKRRAKRGEPSDEDEDDAEDVPVAKKAKVVPAAPALTLKLPARHTSSHHSTSSAVAGSSWVALRSNDSATSTPGPLQAAPQATTSSAGRSRPRTRQSLSGLSTEMEGIQLSTPHPIQRRPRVEVIVSPVTPRPRPKTSASSTTAAPATSTPAASKNLVTRASSSSTAAAPSLAAPSPADPSPAAPSPATPTIASSTVAARLPAPHAPAAAPCVPAAPTAAAPAATIGANTCLAQILAALDARFQLTPDRSFSQFTQRLHDAGICSEREIIMLCELSDGEFRKLMKENIGMSELLMRSFRDQVRSKLLKK